MDLNETERFTLAVETGGARQTLAFSRQKDGWGCVITDKGGEFEKAFDFPEEVVYYIGERVLAGGTVVLLDKC